MFIIIHQVKTKEDIKILCTCPICLKSLIKKREDNLIVENKELLIYDKTKLIENKMKNNEDYTIICSCGSFKMIYENRLEKEIRSVSDENKNSNNSS